MFLCSHNNECSVCVAGRGCPSPRSDVTWWADHRVWRFLVWCHGEEFKPSRGCVYLLLINWGGYSNVCLCAGERLGHSASAAVCRALCGSENEETNETRSCSSSSDGKQARNKLGVKIRVSVWPSTFCQINSIKSTFFLSRLCFIENKH